MCDRPEPDNLIMSEHDDAVAAKMLARIAARFPTVPSARLEAIVQEEQDRLSGGRIRDYIPVLVERATTERLRREAPAVPLTADQEPHAPASLPTG